MDAQDAAVASFMTVKSHFESIMVSPTAPGSPSTGRPKAIAQAYLKHLLDQNKRQKLRSTLLRKQREFFTLYSWCQINSPLTRR